MVDVIPQAVAVPDLAALAQAVQALVAQVRLFQDQQVNLYGTAELIASVTDGEGNAKIIPSWRAVQSAGSEAGANADLAAASIYNKVVIVDAGSALQLATGSGASFWQIQLSQPSCALTLQTPAIEATRMKQVTLLLRQGSGANQVAWPANVVWPFGQKPVLSYEAGQFDLVTLLFNGGDQWLGFFAAGGFAS